ncbi:MAG: OmpH family outer membrane protein [Muribaculaceae bacterium]|nr:OmpH family outer membrane protein [Muribaculaceae bacterium]
MFKKILLLIAVLLPMSALAQKFATVDLQEIIPALPEFAAMNTQLEASGKQYQEELQKLQTETEKLFGEYQTIADDPNTPQSIKDRRMQEIQERAQKIEQFREQAQSDINRQQAQLLAPIQQKVAAAITAVGQEAGYTFIFAKDDSMVLYSGSDVVDATPALKAKLGI